MSEAWKKSTTNTRYQVLYVLKFNNNHVHCSAIVLASSLLTVNISSASIAN